MRNQYAWKGFLEQSYTVIVMDLWREYIGEWSNHPDNYLQTMLMLQESIRKCMRAEYDSYLRGKATIGRVAETKGHAVLLGKIIAEYKRYQPEELVARGQVQPIAEEI